MSESSQLPLFHVVGFSGHRSVENPAGVARALVEVLESLRKETSGEWLALSSVADGSDQMFVAQARSLGLSWHAILPLPRAEFARDFSAADWPAVETMLAHAEHVHVIAENGTREDAYLDCGLETVNGSDVLLAVWDGQPARGKGGTADVVAYALSIGKPVVVIDARTLAVRRENFDNLKRDDRHLATLNRLPDATGGWGENPFQAPANIFAFQQKCDHAASRGAPFFRRLIVATVIFHVAATLIASAGLSFGLHLTVLPWLKLLCLVGALGVAVFLHRHQHSMQNWVNCRLAAEFCRSALATWGLPRATPLFEDINLPHVRGLTRTLHVLHSRSAAAQSVSMDEFKRVYLAKRIDDQLAYYRRQEERALPLFGRLKLGFWIATILALGCTLAYALCHTAHVEVPEWITNSVFYFLPISLPVVAAAFISFVSINDLQRRVARYREMQLMLEDTRRRLVFCQTWNSLERVVLKTERALRQEMLEWHSITSFTESH
jgi:hypothetical protein